VTEEDKSLCLAVKFAKAGASRLRRRLEKYGNDQRAETYKSPVEFL